MTPNQDALITELEYQKTTYNDDPKGDWNDAFNVAIAIMRNHFVQSASPDPSGDVVERVARAIHDTCAEFDKPPGQIPCYGMNRNKEGWRLMAKAVLAAMDTARGETIMGEACSDTDQSRGRLPDSTSPANDAGGQPDAVDLGEIIDDALGNPNCSGFTKAGQAVLNALRPYLRERKNAATKPNPLSCCEDL